MALLWLEGWEGSCTSVTLDRYYTNVSFTGSFVDNTTGASLAAGTCAASTGQSDFRTPVLTTVNRTDYILGFAFRSGRDDSIQNGGTDPAGFQFLNSDGEQCRLEFYDDDGSPQPPGANLYRVRLMRDATELCATEVAFPVRNDDSTWIYFEFKVSIDNTTGSVVGRYRYTQKPSLNPSGGWTTLTWDAANTSLDTQQQTSTGADRVGITMANTRLDDLYICDNTGTKNNDYLGKLVIVGQKPSGDGTTVEFDQAGGASSTQNAWDEVIDVDPTSGADDLRLSTDTTNQVHLATVDALAGLTSSAAIVGLRQDLVARMETSGDLDIVHRYRKTTATAGETDGGTVNITTTGWVADADILEDDPNTATDWDIADLDSYEHGAKNGG